MIISVDNMCDHPTLSAINVPASMDAKTYLYLGLTSLALVFSEHLVQRRERILFGLMQRLEAG